jgi:aminopeptidase N
VSFFLRFSLFPSLLTLLTLLTLPTLLTLLTLQCQQYGFQRIAPSLDCMAAKCYYTTTIVADKRYTNLISNGDYAPGYNPSIFRST